MYRAHLQKLEGVWTGEEQVEGDGGKFTATGRLTFHTIFDGRFLLVDYIQNVPDKPPSVGHGVFRKDDDTNKLTVTWFRSPSATPSQQSDGVAEGDALIFVENNGKASTRTTYTLALNRLNVITERSTNGNDWTTIFEGAYRRPRG